MESEDKDVLLLLGRLDGKVDTILNQQASHADTLASVQARLTNVERDTAILQAQANSNKSWFTSIGSGLASIAALVLSVWGNLK